MSKTTKIIAALGVAAGLGVAALPAFTYADESTTGDVQVQVNVNPAIAMTIEGNNDDSTDANHHSTGTWTVVASPTGNPSASSYYELSGHTYTLSTDTEVDENKTYYTLSTPTYAEVDNASPSTMAGQTLDGHVIANPLVSGTSSSYASLLPNATVTGSASNGFRSTITVYTNNASGFNLTLIDKDSNTDLTHTDGSSYIPATSSTSLEGGTAAWGYKVFSQHGDEEGTGATETGNTDWTAVQPSTGTAATISSLNTKTDGGDQTIVDYGVATAGDQATGVYSDIIVYTATTK